MIRPCLALAALCLYFFPIAVEAISLDKTHFKTIDVGAAPHWMDVQIQKDFSPYQDKITSQKIDELFKTFDPNKNLLVRFKVVDNKLTMEMPYADWSGRHSFVKDAMSFLVESTGLPNLDVIFTLHDEIPDALSSQLPILTFAKKKNAHGILIPDAEALIGYERNPDLKKEALHLVPWDQKEKKAFWRGTTTGGTYTKDNWHKIPRSQLVLLSLIRPDLIDAKFTKTAQCEEGVPEILSANHMMSHFETIPNHLKYRYLVDVDGNSCTYPRYYWILLSTSLPFKQVSDNVQWFYGALVSYQHYVPLEVDSSDIFEKVKWAKEHDEEAKQIAANGTEFAATQLSPENIYLYLYKVLLEYAKHQDLSQ